MAHAIRAILLASAMAATLVGRRAKNAVSQGRCPVPCPGDGALQATRSRWPRKRDRAGQPGVM
jgi:hypothetical protein